MEFYTVQFYLVDHFLVHILISPLFLPPLHTSLFTLLPILPPILLSPYLSFPPSLSLSPPSPLPPPSLYLPLLLPSLSPSSSVQKNSNLTGQLAAANKSHQEAQEQLTRLHTELRRAKSAAKTPTGGEGRGQLERVTELEGRLHHAEEDNLSLQVLTIITL